MTRSAPITVQLYSVRTELADLDVALGRLAYAGTEAIEPYSPYDRPTELAAAADRHGLAVPSVHAPLLSDEMEFGGRSVPVPPAQAAIAAAQALGAGLVVDPMVAAARWRTSDDVARTADRLNSLVDDAAAQGLTVGYHNHSFEFHHRIGDVTAYEHFVSLLDERVALELDVYWAAAAGQDVPALVARLGSRVQALHLKDAPAAVDVFAADRTYDPAVLGQCALGSGGLAIEATLDAVPEGCLPVVEFDDLDDDVFEMIAASVAHLGNRHHGRGPVAGRDVGSCDR